MKDKMNKLEHTIGQDKQFALSHFKIYQLWSLLVLYL